MKIVPQRRRGTALLFVVVLLSVMGTIVLSNTRRLSLLKREIQLIDQRQQRKYVEKAPAQTQGSESKKTGK